jgi:predicted DNA-binding transcriptional regulator AlpA
METACKRRQKTARDRKPTVEQPSAIESPPLILSEKQTAKTLNLSVDTLKRLVKLGQGPRRIVLSRRRIGYLLKDLEKWIADREQS